MPRNPPVVARTLVLLVALAVLAGACTSLGATEPPQAAPLSSSAATSTDPSGTSGTGPSASASATTMVETTLTTAATTTVPETTTTARPPLARALGPGSSGDDVRRLQERLREVGFDPGEPDGVFGTLTTQAVWAYEKLVLGETGKQVNGVVTPEMWERLQGPLGVVPRRPGWGRHLEVYLPQQVAVLFHGGAPRVITHVSTGSGADWCALGWCGKAVTPGGVYKFTRRVSGWRESKLGRLYNPVYFNYGIAVHGFLSVPSYPASKGCVRIPMHIAEYFPSLVRNGDPVFVFDGKKEPEAYGAQPPPIDTPDPNAPSSTTSVKPGSSTTTEPGASTTTKPPATSAPPTTAPPTTPNPPTTTTTAPPPTDPPPPPSDG